MTFSFNIKQKIVFGSSLALVLVIILSLVSYRSIVALVHTAHWVKHTHHVISNASLIEKLVVDLETGERGFLIAGKEEFLEPYESGIKDLSALLKETIKLVSYNPGQVVKLREGCWGVDIRIFQNHIISKQIFVSKKTILLINSRFPSIFMFT